MTYEYCIYEMLKNVRFRVVDRLLTELVETETSVVLESTGTVKCHLRIASDWFETIRVEWESSEPQWMFCRWVNSHGGSRFPISDPEFPENLVNMVLKMIRSECYES
jgi:hypothetical protein